MILLSIPVLPSQQLPSRAGVVEFRQQCLINAQLTAPETVARPGQVEPPDAIRFLRNKGPCLAVPRFEVPQPATQGKAVVFAQIFHVADLEPAAAAEGNRAGVAQMRWVQAAVQTAGDVLARLSGNSTSQGVGLRGGTFRVVQDGPGASRRNLSIAQPESSKCRENRRRTK